MCVQSSFLWSSEFTTISPPLVWETHISHSRCLHTLVDRRSSSLFRCYHRLQEWVAVSARVVHFLLDLLSASPALQWLLLPGWEWEALVVPTVELGLVLAVGLGLQEVTLAQDWRLEVYLWRAIQFLSIQFWFINFRVYRQMISMTTPYTPII